VTYSLSGKNMTVGGNFRKSRLGVGNPAKGGEFGSKSKYFPENVPLRRKSHLKKSAYREFTVYIYFIFIFHLLCQLYIYIYIYMHNKVDGELSGSWRVIGVLTNANLS
jgi:hypothetical protein